MRCYDIAVVGGGPAGAMAAIRAKEHKRGVVLIERNNSIGKKLLLTGKGRCNISNSAPIDVFLEKFGRQGPFYRTAFGAFSSQDLADFFESRGLKFKIERQGRIFPVTDSSESVAKTLKESLASKGVEMLYNMRLSGLKKRDSAFKLDFEGRPSIAARRVILSTGGSSYRSTGSTGDGFRIAEKLGHTILPITPALVPLTAKEKWLKGLSGLTLKNVRLTFLIGKKKVTTGIGECLFTHFGVSGPLVLDISGRIVSMMEKFKTAQLLIDLKPALSEDKLEARLLREFQDSGNKDIKNIMGSLVPQRLGEAFLKMARIGPGKKCNQVTQKERSALITLFKSLTLTVTGSLPVEEAMVTDGGVSTKEIDPKTMESRIVPGLYFAGEIIDGSAPSGGYSLQQAFSTGYLAGEKAASA
ncbi:MAG: NAD(P)/FAD-dependent oxidoreductase [Candidatus Omnitrophota bacterium]